MNWERIAFGPRGRYFGNTRYLIGAMLAVAAGVISATGTFWLETVLFAAVAIVLFLVWKRATR